MTPGARERWWSIWARRALTFPAFALVAALLWGGAPFWLLGALVLDTAAGQRGKLPRTRAIAFFGLYFASEIAGLAAAGGLWLASLGGRLGGEGWFLHANAALQRWWTGTLFQGGVALFSLHIRTEGLEQIRGPLLLFVRHSSVADTVLAAALVANPARLLLRYVLKRELLWDPCLDVVGQRLPNAFVARGSDDPATEIAAVARLTEGLDERSGVLIYPEGTRFTPAKLTRAVGTLRAKGLHGLADIAARYRHVLPPRLGGPLALLAAAPGLDVCVLEHAGLEGAATFANFWNGSLIGAVVHVRLRRIPADALPTIGRDAWLFERWAEVDRWISEVA